jgi:hypothetical protein
MNHLILNAILIILSTVFGPNSDALNLIARVVSAPTTLRSFSQLVRRLDYPSRTPHAKQAGSRITQQWLHSLSPEDCLWRFR